MSVMPFRKLADIDDFFKDDDGWSQIEEGLDEDLMFDTSEVPYFGTLTLAMLHRLLVPGWKKTLKMVEGQTLLHYSLKQESQSTLRMLIEEHGLDVDAPDGRRNSPLQTAVKLGYVQSVATLIRAGADINRRDSGGLTSLHVAARNALGDNDMSSKFCKIIQLLLHANADIDAVTAVGSATALHLACKHGNVKEALLLLHSGAKHSVQDRLGNTSMHLVAGDVDKRCFVVLLMAFGASANIKNCVNTSAMHSAAEHSEEPKVSLATMFCFNAKLGEVDQEGNSLLHNAAKDEDLVVFLLNNIQGNVKYLDFQNSCGYTPLHHFAVRHTTKGGKVPEDVLRSIQLLLRSGASVRPKNKAGLAIYDSVKLFNLCDVRALLDEEVNSTPSFVQCIRLYDFMVF